DRLIDGKTAVREQIVLPAALFAGLDRLSPLPNTLYSLYQADFGVSIVSASEQIQSVAATRDDAETLDLAPGAPLLQVDRTAYDITGRAIELRQSRFATGALVYAVELR
ncbi:MAG: UTRA domain-containing protein, partial [Parvularculaceae bacterium]|nr:UTRA domain-containing protein [Parvularculaceae bacterium]